MALGTMSTRRVSSSSGAKTENENDNGINTDKTILLLILINHKYNVIHVVSLPVLKLRIGTRILSILMKNIPINIDKS